jgi:hypothetical protein
MSHAKPEVPPHGFGDELRDAVSFRAFALVLGGLVIQLAFIVSYLGAFHSPTPHRIPTAIVAPQPLRAQIVAKLNALPSKAVHAVPAADEAEARRWILDRTVYAGFLYNPVGTADTLLVASAGGPSVSQTAAQIAQELEKAQSRRVTVTDIRPPGKGDGRGMTSFYLVLGWVIGGYLTATILGMTVGSRPANRHRTFIRLGVLALYAIVSGIAGAVIVGPVFDALSGHFWPLAGIGALVVFASAAVSVALQTLFGTLGTGLCVILFVVLGNPSSGGVYPAALLPRFWSAIGQSLPPGAGTTLVRNTVYFTGHDTAHAWWVLGAYAVGGNLVTLVTVLWTGRRARAAPLSAPAATA